MLTKIDKQQDNNDLPPPSGAVGRSFLSRWTSLVGWMGIAGGIAVCLLSISAFIAPGYWFTDNMSFFLRQFFGAGLCGFLAGASGLTVAHRQPRLYGKAVLVLAVLLITVFGLMAARVDAITSSTANSPTTTSSSIRVVSINLERLFLVDETLSAFLQQTKPDVLVLEETGWGWQRHRWQRRIGATPIAGHGALPEHLFAGRLGDLVVFSRFPISASETIDVIGNAETHDEADREILSLTLDVDGAALKLLALHPASPRTRPRWMDRQAYLATLNSQIQKSNSTEDRAEPTLVIGDWNLSPWSGHFLKMLTDNNLRTAFPGGIPQTTRFFFDYRLHWLLGAVVDHFAVTPDIEIQKVELGPDIGSDHLPLIVDVAIQNRANAD